MTTAEEHLAAAKAAGDTRLAEYWAHIIATVDAAPPLTKEQMAKLTVLLRKPEEKK